MPAPFTCDGVNVSPPVAWIKLPQGTKSVALMMEDPDAAGGDFVHWSVYNIPPIGVGIAAGQLPLGARQGKNSFGKEGYGGPCPPKGDDAHHYVITVYGLKRPIAARRRRTTRQGARRDRPPRARARDADDALRALNGAPDRGYTPRSLRP